MGSNKKALINCSEILVVDLEMSGKPKRGKIRLDSFKDGGIIYENDTIMMVGRMEDLEPHLDSIEDVIDCKGKLVTPGLIDSHTHAVFFGTREDEYELRIKGASYSEIAKSGGGILNSSRRVRMATQDELVEHTLPYLDSFISTGITTIECKSGYGLDTEAELKMLRAIKELNSIHELDLVPTFMGAHEVPEEYRKGKKSKYIELVINEMLPKVASESLAEYCDVFCEKGVYTPLESERILRAGKKHGLKPRIHADEIKSTGGSELAARISAKSADHLGAISPKGIKALSESDTVATLLPGTVMFLNLPEYAPARKLIDSGTIVALATDFNPGSSPSNNLPLIMGFACSRMRMTIEEAWAAVTINAAYSLDRSDKIGLLMPGYKADMVVWDVEKSNSIPYHYGMNLAKMVFKNGKLVYEKK
ncbi:MAG: imidazolonepropionase [Candidatus Zixiibacteriota bacterium]